MPDNFWYQYPDKEKFVILVREPRRNYEVTAVLTTNWRVKWRVPSRFHVIEI